MRTKLKIFLWGLLTIVIFLLSMTFINNSTGETSEEARAAIQKASLDYLKNDTYGSAFLSMYPTTYYKDIDFEHFWGDKIHVPYFYPQTPAEFSVFLETTLSSDNDIHNIFLGIDPSKFSDSPYYELSQNVLNYVEDNPNIFFWIFIAHPHINYWQSLDKESLNNTLSKYYQVCSELLPYDNVYVSFDASEEWLITTQSNYKNDSLTLSKEAAEYVFLNSVGLQLTKENIDEKFDTLRELINASTNEVYPDLSDTCLVFMCDSLIANNTSSSSIPSILSELTNVTCIDLSIGGVPATANALSPVNLSTIVDSFLNNAQIDYESATRFNRDVVRFYDALSQGTFANKKMCFVIDMCLNDYFLGLPMSSTLEDDNSDKNYISSLTENIKKLKNAYPDADIILMAPYYILEFNEGRDAVTEEGYVLTDYIDAMKNVATQNNLKFINLYEEFSPTMDGPLEYLSSDLTHPSNQGRMYIARFLARNIK